MSSVVVLLPLIWISNIFNVTNEIFRFHMLAGKQALRYCTTEPAKALFHFPLKTKVSQILPRRRPVGRNLIPRGKVRGTLDVLVGRRSWRYCKRSKGTQLLRLQSSGTGSLSVEAIAALLKEVIFFFTIQLSVASHF